MLFPPRLLVIHWSFFLNGDDLFIEFSEFNRVEMQYKNANVANFVLAAPLESKETNEVCNLEI